MPYPQDQVVALAAASDSDYALPLAVMLRSAGNTLSPGGRIEARVVDDGLSAEQRAKIEASLTHNVSIDWIRRPTASAIEFAGLPKWGRMSRATYHKLTLAEWLPPDLNKVLWLDCDVLVLRSLSDLWKQELGGSIALAVPDTIVPEVGSRFGVAGYRHLGLPPSAPYFNAGVMMIDLDQWRQDRVMVRARDYLNEYGDRVTFWDQEALNASIAARWSSLDPRWNWNPVAPHIGRGFPSADPWLVHFCGNLKPWKHLGSSKHHAGYYRTLDQTAWSGFRPSRSWRGRLLASYQHSSLRTLLYPMEQVHLRLTRFLSRR